MWARHLAFSLWRGEEYVLQIDSHMRYGDALSLADRWAAEGGLTSVGK